MQDKNGPHYMRAKEISAHFKIGEATFWRWVKVREGFPQPLKISDRISLFDRVAIENYFRPST